MFFPLHFSGLTRTIRGILYNIQQEHQSTSFLLSSLQWAKQILSEETLGFREALNSSLFISKNIKK